MSRLKEIFYSKPEIMSSLVKWVFALPLAYVVYIVLSLFIPNLSNSPNVIIFTHFLRSFLLVLCILLVVKYFLKFDLGRFLSESGKFSTALFFKGLFFMMLALTVTNICFAFIFPGNIVVNCTEHGRAANWLCSFLLVIVSSFSEELIFRSFIGWFSKSSNPEDSLCKVKKSYIIYALISAIFFSIAHFSNPEVDESALWSMLFYFIFGFCLMLFFLRTRGLEFSLGVHFANNIFSAWFVNYQNSVLPTDSLFISRTPIGFITVLQATVCLVFCAFLCPENKVAVNEE